MNESSDFDQEMVTPSIVMISSARHLSESSDFSQEMLTPSIVMISLARRQKGWTPTIPGGHLQSSPIHLS